MSKMNTISMKCEIGGKELSIETGKVALFADGAVTVQYGDTVILATVVMEKEVKEGLDFLPLTVEYREKTYAAGKIPGGFFKREGRPREKEILSSRIIDRSIRPLFAKGMFNGLQVVVMVLSSDQENDGDLLGVLGVSAALSISDIPFSGPIGVCRIGRIEGQFIINPTISQLSKSDIEIVVSGTKNAIIMVEGCTKEISEDEMVNILSLGHTELKKTIVLQEELMKKCETKRNTGSAKVKQTVELFKVDEILNTTVSKFFNEKITGIGEISDKNKWLVKIDAAKKETLSHFSVEFKDQEGSMRYVMEETLRHVIRQSILEKGVRPDGRKYNEIREISCEIGVLPRTHGSALFSRGQTQALVITTLGTDDDAQIIDDLEGESKKRYMLQYNFPPFSVGEARAMRGPGRREIGHGALAEKAIAFMIPSQDTFPYTIQVVSDIMMSDGSTSMATVCGASLSLMDAVIPIKGPVAGIAMGLIKGNEKCVILTDLKGIEDHCGDMDYKVAGTVNGITAIQMDLKIQGIDIDILSKALAQAKEARLIILNKMAQVIDKSKTELSVYAPRIITIKVPSEKVKDVIGPSGKIIKKIIELTGVKIDIEDDGNINISAVDMDACNKAMDMIKEIVQDPEIDKIYRGKVKKIMDFGAFVEIMPGRDGLVHISELSNERVKRVEDVVNEGDEILVKVIEIDRAGKIRLSMKRALDKECDEKEHS